MGTLQRLYLGVINVWCKIAVWALLDSDVYGQAGGRVEAALAAILALRASRMAWYRRRHEERPAEGITRVSDLTLKMLGARQDPKCKTKGAEAWGLALF